MSAKKRLSKEGGFQLDLEECQALVGKRKINLTTTECNLLGYLLKNRGDTLSRSEILDGVWGDDFKGTERTVDTHIQRLRRKLGKAGRHIQTIRGAGYRLYF